ncbi:hypothetical protein BWQ96_04202 [Gracilariopsis chorda]|uniref:Uncharacterized protein n=1 Tax=Gracilariopsis chorda TaxID=448386 RepID=A0A2V3IWD3_9FLOR|nr:hypothetical protein BWQ96_04202 [Gracilariopsis chorda]|eukprot:PXF46027.1 hypothetical protein BWQ96_04202 [Gracilariopsis chorda]
MAKLGVCTLSNAGSGTAAAPQRAGFSCFYHRHGWKAAVGGRLQESERVYGKSYVPHGPDIRSGSGPGTGRSPLQGRRQGRLLSSASAARGPGSIGIHGGKRHLHTPLYELRFRSRALVLHESDAPGRRLPPCSGTPGVRLLGRLLRGREGRPGADNDGQRRYAAAGIVHSRSVRSARAAFASVEVLVQGRNLPRDPRDCRGHTATAVPTLPTDAREVGTRCAAAASTVIKEPPPRPRLGHPTVRWSHECRLARGYRRPTASARTVRRIVGEHGEPQAWSRLLRNRSSRARRARTGARGLIIPLSKNFAPQGTP